MKSILDPTFHYTPAASTDLRKTFQRVRREMRREAERAAADAAQVVRPLPARTERKA